jgi:hypothetical protein
MFPRIGTVALIGTYSERIYQGNCAKATLTGGLPVPVAAIAFPRPVHPCFPNPESRNLNRLRLISFCPARTRAGSRPEGQPSGGSYALMGRNGGRSAAILLPGARDRDEALATVRELSRNAAHLRRRGEFPRFGVGIVTIRL